LSYKPSAVGTVSNLELAFKNKLLALNWAVPYKTSERVLSFYDGGTNNGVEIKDFYLNPANDKYIFKATDNQIAVYRNATNQKKAMAVDFLNMLRKDVGLARLLFYGEEGRNYELNAKGHLDYGSIAGRYLYDFACSTYMDTPEAKLFSANMTDAQIEKAQTWDDGDNVKVSPLNGLSFTLTGEVDNYLSMINAVDSSYVTAFLYGATALDAAGTGGTKYIEFKNKISGNMDKLIAELQKQVDAYCAENGI
jgi:hypothetical protein